MAVRLTASGQCARVAKSRVARMAFYGCHAEASISAASRRKGGVFSQPRWFGTGGDHGLYTDLIARLRDIVRNDSERLRLSSHGRDKAKLLKDIDHAIKMGQKQTVRDLRLQARRQNIDMIPGVEGQYIADDDLAVDLGSLLLENENKNSIPFNDFEKILRRAIELQEVAAVAKIQIFLSKYEWEPTGEILTEMCKLAANRGLLQKCTKMILNDETEERNDRFSQVFRHLEENKKLEYASGIAMQCMDHNIDLDTDICERVLKIACLHTLDEEVAVRVWYFLDSKELVALRHYELMVELYCKLKNQTKAEYWMGKMVATGEYTDDIQKSFILIARLSAERGDFEALEQLRIHSRIELNELSENGYMLYFLTLLNATKTNTSERNTAEVQIRTRTLTKMRQMVAYQRKPNKKTKEYIKGILHLIGGVETQTGPWLETMSQLGLHFKEIESTKTPTF
ncbi:hypothetical protein AAMO2058_001568300 [Amorphochlora amoebiformis]